MYNQIREYLRDPSPAKQLRMAKAIAKSSAVGTISDAANAWLKAYQEKSDLIKSENELKKFFRVDQDEV